MRGENDVFWGKKRVKESKKMTKNAVFWVATPTYAHDYSLNIIYFYSGIHFALGIYITRYTHFHFSDDNNTGSKYYC